LKKKVINEKSPTWAKRSGIASMFFACCFMELVRVRIERRQIIE